MPDDRTSHSPLVTIGMPVLNGGWALHLAVRSLIAQSMTDWELLMMDDGSTDGATDAILEYGDPRIHLIRDGLNKGVAVRLNEALNLARGRYFARMDHDDISHPERLRLQVAALEADPGIDLLAGRCIRMSEDLRLIGYVPFAAAHEDICRQPWRRILMAHPTWMGRVEWFRRHKYSVPAPYYAEDFELLLRARDSSRYAALPQLLLAYRMHEHVYWKKSLRARMSQFAVQARHFQEVRRPAGVALSATVLAIRLGADLWRLARQAAGLRPIPERSVDPGHAAEWTKIIGQLHACLPTPVPDWSVSDRRAPDCPAVP